MVGLSSSKSKELAAFRYHLYVTITLMVVLIVQVSIFQTIIRTHQETLKAKMDTQHLILQDMLNNQIKIRTVLETIPINTKML